MRWVSWILVAASLIAAGGGSPLAQEYDRPYNSTADQYPSPPVERKDFAPLDFIEVPEATAVFTMVMVDGIFLEEVKDEIRRKLPNAHVRQIISSADVADQTLMVMWHPKEAFRPAINDYFRVLNPMRGIKETHTYLGTSDRFPASFPVDTLLGWKFIEFNSNISSETVNSMTDRLLADPDVLEVSRLAFGGSDLVVVYRFSGASVAAMQEVKSRIGSLIGDEGIRAAFDRACP